MVAEWLRSPILSPRRDHPLCSWVRYCTLTMPSPSPRCKTGRCSGGRNPAMVYELIWGRQWLPHTWKPHVITVVHLLNSPVLNSMINSCKQYCLCDKVYSYLIFVLYFTVIWSKGWHYVITRKWIKIWLMAKKANDCGCNNLFIYFEILLNQIKPTVLGHQSKHALSRLKSPKLAMIFSPISPKSP